MGTLSISKSDRQDILPKQDESNESLPACFERVAAAHHLRTALVSDGWQLTYAELNVAANRLAHALLARGGAARGRIAILMQHDSPLIVAMLAVLKAARVVVVLRPADPVDELRQIMGHVDPDSILTDLTHRDLAAEIAGESCAMVDFGDHATWGAAHNPDIQISPGATAALVYSSGTTGRPKAVMLTHRQLIAHVARLARGLETVPQDRIAHFTSSNTSWGIASSLLALLNGAALCSFAAREKRIGDIGDWMAEREITATVWPTSFFRHFIKTLKNARQFPRMRIVQIGAESGTSEDFAAFRKHFPPGCAFVHYLGCTEVGSVAQLRLSHGDSVAKGRLPAGRPYDGIEVSIEDEHGNDVGPGEIGEIAVRGRALAAGYWRDAALTASRFSQSEPGSEVRVFRGGDLGRFNADGLLEYVGRKDSQIKVHGFRVILTDVEDAIRRMPAVESAAVCSFEQPNGDVRIVAYVVLRDSASTFAGTLRRALRASLPDHMVPSAFVFLDRLPLTANGKIDHQKLRQIQPPDRADGPPEPPQSPTEALLAGIWAEVLEISNIGRHDDFFALGGDSLLATVIAARVHDAVKVELNLAIFADFSTLKELALVIDQLRAGGADDSSPVVPAPRNEPLPLSFAQERIWQFSQTAAASVAYTSASIFRIVGPLDVGLLRDCMDDLVRRHEILRTTFARQGERPVSIVHPPAPTPLQYFDLSDMTDPEAQAEVIIKKEAAFVFDLSRGPLLRFTLVRLGDGEYRLSRVSHHIISDGTSWLVYFRELARLYEAKLRGEAPPLPELAPLQYGDYAVWQRKALHPEALAYRQAVSWWKDNLSGAPPALSLPFTRVDAKPDVAPADGWIFWGIERQVASRLNALASAQKATRPMVRLAAFAALLAAESGQPDVVIGLYVTGRNRLALQNMIGDFSNLVTLRFRSDPTKSFIAWLSIVRRQVLDAEAHSAIPYENLRQEFQRGGLGLPQIKVIFHPSPLRPAVEFAGLKLIWMEPRFEAMPWGFSMALDEQTEQHLHCAIFDAHIYDPVGVHALVDRYKRLLEAASRHPDWALSELLTTGRLS